MKNKIILWLAAWGSAALLAVTIVVLFITVVIPTHTIVHKGPCKFESWDQGREHIILRLKCGEVKAWTSHVDALFSQIKYPNVTFHCRVNAKGQAFC